MCEDHMTQMSFVDGTAQDEYYSTCNASCNKLNSNCASVCMSQTSLMRFETEEDAEKYKLVCQDKCKL